MKARQGQDKEGQAGNIRAILNHWQIKAIQEGIREADNGLLYSTEAVLKHLDSKHSA